ncbi:hypothetical protein BpHYR1_003948 [Brachionus plicatilis]|uniref:Uncharacterized protein n=1 Tax=Brachionus plicatilis TaxID=10195 RepID=A0A3M7S862_BRAPC|nr:hypothetical protein BpHYR1_003948 [Brachionus plicatilis]
MIKYGSEIVRQTVRKILNCRKDDEVIDIIEALKMEGDKRRIRQFLLSNLYLIFFFWVYLFEKIKLAMDFWSILYA